MTLVLILDFGIARNRHIVKPGYVYIVHNNLSNKLYTVHKKLWIPDGKLSCRVERPFATEICAARSCKLASIWRVLVVRMR